MLCVELRLVLAVLFVGIVIGSISTWLYAEAAMLAPIKDENFRLKEELNSTSAKLAEVTSMLESLKEERDALTKQLSEAKLAIQQKNEQLSQLTEMVSKLKTQLAELQSNTTTRQGSLEQETMIVLLPDEDYYRWVRNMIAVANESIHVAVFSIKYDPKESVGNDPVNYLLAKLVDAKRRGLDVKVIVDDYTYEKYRDTINYLKREGVQVRLDPSRSTTMHVKLVIVDSKWLFVGSHNWTESALKYNREYSVLIGSETYASKAEDYFENLWRHGRTP